MVDTVYDVAYRIVPFRRKEWTGHEVLTLPIPYDPGTGQVEVMCNGRVLQPGVDYEETDQWTITLRTVPPRGAVVTVKVIEE